MLREFWEVLKQTFKEWNQDRIPRHAAALAFFTALSIAPLLVVVVALVGAFYGQQAAEGQIVQQIQATVGADGAEVVQDMIVNAQQSGGSIISTLISVGVLLISATALFGQLQTSLNDIWGVEPAANSAILSIIRQRLLSFGMIAIIGFLLLVSLILSTFVSTLQVWLASIVPAAQIFIQILGVVVSFGLTTLLFALIFKFLPDGYIRWQDVGVGAVVTALLFTIGQFALSLYLGNSSMTSVYGAAGSFMVILLWVFYSAQIVLFGAEFTQVYARRYGEYIVSDNDGPSEKEDMEEGEEKSKQSENIAAS